MELLEKELQPFLNNSNFVFKSCQKNWIVVLEKIPETSGNEGLYTKTNEKREVYNPNCAKYRGNRFKVVAIINKFDPTKKIDSAESTYCFSVIYKVGEMVESYGFHSDLTKVCAEGIHYFKTPEPAYYYELDFIKNGIFKRWYENGRIWSITNYKDGKRNGEFEKWHENGQLSQHCYFKDDKENGEFTYYYENGQLFKHFYFENGKINGKCKTWHENGQLLQHSYFKDQKLDGEFTSWYDNDQLKEKCHYKMENDVANLHLGTSIAIFLIIIFIIKKL